MFLTVAFGLVFMVGRFIALLKANLKEPPDNLAGTEITQNLAWGTRIPG